MQSTRSTIRYEKRRSKVEKKVLGILGGMGPEASEVFYHKIINATHASCDQDHLDVLLWSHAAIPDRTAMIKAGRTEELWQVFARDIAMMKAAGIDYLAVPCNTSHYFAKEMDEAMDHHFINMITCAASHAKECGFKRVGVLATDGTVEADLYGKALHEEGITCFYPDKEDQKVVMSIIYEEIKKGKKGSLEYFEAVLSHMQEKGCEAVILACTELSVLKMNYPTLNRDCIIDAMDVLCEACITSCGGKMHTK